MQVRRDFEQLYRSEEDPWRIGDADDERYDAYYELLAEPVRGARRLLDIGCGMGAFTARFRGLADRITGVELSETAVRRGRERYPDIDFRAGSAADLGTAVGDDERFDVVFYSDVIYYLRERERVASLEWIAEHLEPGGLLFLNAWAPGGRYLEREELRRLVARRFAIEDELFLASEHAIFLARPRRTLVALTVDYETWNPLPDGRTIDWGRDVFGPADALMAACEREGATLTLFAEMGELLWAREHEPAVAERLAAQLREAVERGHDVQLHLHPNWLPETGARRDGERWHWDERYVRAADFPGDLGAVIARAKGALEEIVGREVTVFRAGAYEAQPFERLYDALRAAGLRADSSVYAGGRVEGRGFDYRHAPGDHAPWHAARTDPALVAPPAERGLIELPILAWQPGSRWTFDGDEGARFAERLARSRRGDRLSSEAFRRVRRWARWLPAALVPDAPPLGAPGHEYRILVGHTKTDLDVAAIGHGIRALLSEPGVEIVGLGELARLAEADLVAARRRAEREASPCVPAGVPPAALADAVPLDRERALEVGTAVTAPMRWLEVEHVPPDALAGRLPFADAAFDLVVADRVLECAGDPARVLGELARVLAPGGVLVAAIRAEAALARRSQLPWRTHGPDVRRRLEAAGFVDVEVRDGAPLVVRAWRRDAPLDDLGRAREVMGWLYRRLSPERDCEVEEPLAIVAGGYALCAASTVALEDALRREGIATRWATMEAHDHPRGRGPERIDTHEVLEATFADGRARVLDAMADVVHDASLAELLADPPRADAARSEDPRYLERGYALYTTSEWYRRVRRIAVRADARSRQRFVTVERFLGYRRAATRQAVPSRCT